MGGLQLIEELQSTRASLRDEAGKTIGIIGTSTGGPSWAQTASELQGLGRASCLCVLWDLLLAKLLVWELFMDQLFPLQTISMTVTHSHAQMRPWSHPAPGTTARRQEHANCHGADERTEAEPTTFICYY